MSHDEVVRPVAVTWNLRGSHLRGDVGWPGNVRRRWRIPTVAATVALPGGRWFTGRVELLATAEGEAIDLVSATFPAATVDDAYRLSGELAAYWGLPAEPLEVWYREVRAGLVAGRRINGFGLSVRGPRLEEPSGPTVNLVFLFAPGSPRPVRPALYFEWS
ncbi:hypothetical protein ACFRAR_14880 [Kitasatospora sp. NPDC056651]|uniref:hypothetical protein n=1 Tax=Kitasatospora sp. NPDC056651 TaxID=3345892 RepID=UPI0036BDB361